MSTLQSASTPFKAWYLDDETIYAAATEDEAKAAYREDCGLEPDEEAIREVSAEQLDRSIPEYDENEQATGRDTTLRRYLNEMTKPGFLAATAF